LIFAFQSETHNEDRTGRGMPRPPSESNKAMKEFCVTTELLTSFFDTTFESCTEKYREGRTAERRYPAQVGAEENFRQVEL
jgi:hypothetical protein